MPSEFLCYLQLGAKNYLLLRDLVSPATPREKSLDELVKVLKFGIASAPAIFQRTMDTLLQGMEGVMCYIDDILVTDKSQDEHLHQLEEVLTRLQKHGLKVGKNKYSFLQPSVEYLGHQIDSEMEALPVTTAQLRYHTRRDPLLGKICKRKLAQQNVSGCTSFQTSCKRTVSGRRMPLLGDQSCYTKEIAKQVDGRVASGPPRK